MGTLSAICLSLRKGERKQAAGAAVLVENSGLQDDAHAGPWHRQVSLLSAESADQVRQGGIADLQPGDFAENLLVSGVDLDALGLGSTLRVGAEAVLTITQIGKTCHAPCIIQAKTGECIMPKRGLFARVLQGGPIAPGDPVEPLVVVPRAQLQCVVLTISDRCSRGETVDTAGPATARLLQAELGAHLYRLEIIPDEQPLIAARLRHYADGHSIDLVVTAGGTGFSPRDVTPEAVAEVIQRPTPGLDEAMRAASLRVTSHAMLSRACSGIRGGTLIITLPGSERGATANLQTLLPALGHGLAKLRGDPSDCAPPRGPAS